MDYRAHYDAYLQRLRLGRQAPSLSFLSSLTNVHLHSIPFENISKIHFYLHQGKQGLQWLPSLPAFLDLLREQGLGGNCYILNSHFGGLLRHLGFRVDIVRATGGNTHLALKVTVEGHAYYVDVGYGAPLFEPIALQEEPHFFRCGEEVRIAKAGDDRFMIDRLANGQSFVTKWIEWKPASMESFDEVITHSLRDEDENPFMRRIVATLYRRGTGYSVINNKLFVKSGNGTEVHEFTDEREWLNMLRATFGIEGTAVREALEFLGDRGIRLF